MKKSLALALGFVLAFAATSAAQSQKFGYCNSVALLADLPEVKQADSDLQAYQTQLTKQGQQKVQELQTKAAELDKKKEQGTISPKDYEEQMTKLQALDQEIKELEQKIYADLSKRKEELYKPILDKVNEAMKVVAKENGFSLVLDTSTGVLLYADESLDVTKLVRAKLGLP